jgi:hypothetical protein
MTDKEKLITAELNEISKTMNAALLRGSENYPRMLGELLGKIEVLSIRIKCDTFPR